MSALNEQNASILLLESMLQEGKDGVKVKKHKKKKRLFKLSAMNELVDQVKFLANKYDELKEGAEEKLGYHWNEVVQNIIFNRFVKPNKELMKRYYTIKRNLEHTEGTGVSKTGIEKEKTDHGVGDDSDKGEETKSKGDSEGTEDAPPPEPEPADYNTSDNIIDINAPVDTRVTAESTTTASAGNYSYETPKAFFEGNMGDFLKYWKKRNKKHKLDYLTIIKPNAEAHTQGVEAFKMIKENKMEEKDLFANPAAMADLFENYFGVTPEAVSVALNEEKQPDAITQINRVTAETKKEATGYQKELKDRGIVMKKNADGSETFEHKYDNDSLKKEKPAANKELDEFIDLRLGTTTPLDAIVDSQNAVGVSAELKKKFKEQSGDELYDAAVRRAEYRTKAHPELSPLNKIQVMKEGLQLDSYYMSDRKKQFVCFNDKDVEEVETLNEGAILLETKGMGNANTDSMKTLVENYDFYLDASDKKVYKKAKGVESLNEHVITVSKSEFDRQRELMVYSPAKAAQWRKLN